MDVPDLAPLWPSVAGPKLPELQTKLTENENLDMDSALAWLRRELAGMQLQDRNLHKQLLTMRSSICGLREELQIERESDGWETDIDQDDRERSDSKPFPGCVTKVEIVRNNNNNHGPRISHIKQDSGILTDDEASDEELEGSVKQMLRTYPPAVRPRSSSFSAIAKRSNSYHAPLVKLEGKMNEKRNDRKPPTVIRVRALSLAAIENERLLSKVSPRVRTHNFSEGVVHRFASMPVINEIPGDDFARNTFRSRTFGVYGRRHSESADGSVPQPEFAVSKMLPAFGPLTRHGSMPVMYSGGRSKSANSPRRVGENNDHQPIRRSTSQLVLSKTDLETESIHRQRYGIYRSTSQISLV